MEKPIAIISGARSGLGKDLAIELVKRGYKVFGTASSTHGIDELKNETNGNAELFQCDISKPEEVKRFGEIIYEKASGNCDLLISNAGILTPGPLEVISYEQIENEFAVNTFGVISFVNTFLPPLRKSKGQILHVSTLSVDIPSPFNGLSAASKAATEKLMEIYRKELEPFGIEVTVAVPASMQTGGPAKTSTAILKVQDGFSLNQKQLYGQAFEGFAHRINNAQSAGQKSADAAREMLDLLKRNPIPQRSPIGEEAKSRLTAMEMEKYNQLKKHF